MNFNEHWSKDVVQQAAMTPEAFVAKLDQIGEIDATQSISLDESEELIACTYAEGYEGEQVEEAVVEKDGKYYYWEHGEDQAFVIEE